MRWLLATVFISLPVSVLTQPTKQDTIITFGNSSFDVRINADEPAQSDDTVAINSIPWVRDLMNDDPHLRSATIFHILYFEPQEGVSYPWRADNAKRLPESEIDLPEQLRPAGYQIAKDGITYFFFPDEGGSYYAWCIYNSHKELYHGCSMLIRYVPDDQIRLYLGSSLWYDTVHPDFARIAAEAHRIVQCELDATQADSLRNRRPTNQVSPATSSSCEDVIS